MFERLNPKQTKFLRDIINGNVKRINILEGSVRSGKTYISLIAWMILICLFPAESKFLMVGKTLTSLKRNCLTILEEFCPKSEFKYSIPKKEAILFSRKIFLEGVSDVRAEHKIRGMTLSGAYCDEITLFSEDFFTMLLSRLSSESAFLLGTTNPDSPSHWLLKKFLTRNDLSLNRWKFLLDDNDTIPKSVRDEMRKEYTGVFYDRFILGNWVQAEGLIYKIFADNKQDYLIDNIDKSKIDLINIGVDYGASRSSTSFVAVAFAEGFRKILILDERILEGVYTPESLYDNFKDFYFGIVNEFGNPYTCYADYGGIGQVITKGLKIYCINNDLKISIKDCFKYKILERINFVLKMMCQKRFFVLHRCQELVESLSSAIWNPKLDNDRLDDGTFNVDVLDAMEYAISPQINLLSNGTMYV